MKQKIMTHLILNPSYFKWGSERLANKFTCSARTIRSIVKKLDSVKENYLRNL